MPKYSLMSRNVRHSEGTLARLNDIKAMIKNLDPDVFGLVEYREKAVRELIQERFPTYDFAMIDGT